MVGRWFGSDEAEGQGLVEYCLILLLVILVILGSAQAMADVVKSQFWDVIAAMP